MANDTGTGTGNGALAFLRAYWWQVGVAVLAGAAWITRVEAAVTRMDRVGRYEGITEGLGRLACLKDRFNASTAGIPCGALLNDWRD